LLTKGVEKKMKIWMRIVLVLVLFALHYLLVFLPVAELFIVYIILFNPRWFRNFLDRMANPEVIPVESEVKVSEVKNEEVKSE